MHVMGREIPEEPVDTGERVYGFLGGLAASLLPKLVSKGHTMMSTTGFTLANRKHPVCSRVA